MNTPISPAAAVPPGRLLIRRHSLTVRLTHWLNVVCLACLLFSGLQIFNAHPRLYWGNYGADADHAFFEIGSRQAGDAPQGFVRIGHLRVVTTGLLGVSREEGNPTPRAFPTWLT